MKYKRNRKEPQMGKIIAALVIVILVMTGVICLGIGYIVGLSEERFKLVRRIRSNEELNLPLY
jgi:hypothetical protein